MYKPASTVRRIDVLIRILGGHKKFLQVNNVRAYSSEGKVTIGDVTKDVTTPKKIEYVPRKYSEYLQLWLNKYSLEKSFKSIKKIFSW